MNRRTTLILAATMLSTLSYAQNVNYTARITQFYGSNCGGEIGNEEHTWKGWISDNNNTSETYSGCIQRNTNGAVTQTGTYASRTQNNVPATELRARIDAWEDDMGNRCDYNTGFNNDDCRANTTCTYAFLNPLEYQATSNTPTCGSSDYNMRLYYDYQYATVTIPAAVDNSTVTYTTGGNRPFWGSRGAWAFSGSDCATSGTITDNQTSSFSTTIECKSSVSFRWRVSSETNYDFLRFYIDGVQQDAISGTPGWTLETYALTPGQHTLEWRYTKDVSISNNDDRGFVDQISFVDAVPPGNPADFGNDEWLVYAYNGRSINLSGVDYRGYYEDANLNINTINSWANNASPSAASSYDGCPVTNDNHTFVHKRRGFPCGIYRIDIADHDDEARLYIDGVQEWNIAGCCTSPSGVWTGYLDNNSTIEFRVAEGGGGSRLQANIVNITTALSGGSISGAQTVCSGDNPSAFTSLGAASGGTEAYFAVDYQWQSSTTGCGSGFSDISGATSLTYDLATAPSQTTYYRREVTDECGNNAYSNCIAVTVNTNSTSPTIAGIAGVQCPNASLTLTASGGTAGSGSDIYWYSGANGTGTLLGTGASLAISPNSTTTYYARRQGTCNTTGDDNTSVSVRSSIYTPTGTSSANDYCTDQDGWHHFYNGSDEVIFSIRGDLSGATANPEITIENNNTYYQGTTNPSITPASCMNGWSPGEELFELPRSWNVDFSGTLNGTYDIRYYFPASEKTDLEAAANAHIAAYPSCSYAYKYPTPNGFYWFKNVGSNYNAPEYDLPTQLTGTTGTFNGLNYAEITGITSFSGGSGAIALSSDPSLPIDLMSFDGWNDGTVNILEWVTASEQNSDRFEIQRSVNGANGFEKIGEMKAAGNSVVTKQYMFVDENPMLGVNYYRLRQVDFDGTEMYSDVIALNVDGEAEGYRFFPNPTEGTLTFQFYNEHPQVINLYVYNNLGQLLQTIPYDASNGYQSIEIALSDYPSGMYQVRVENAVGAAIAVENIVKE